jgi:peptide deformylase
MAVLPIIIAPDARLKTRSVAVDVIDDTIHRLVGDMFDTMYAEKGIGLAAVQVGVLKRILVADTTWRDEGGPGEQYVLINPEVVHDTGDLNVYKEGCLSFPDQFAEVTRPRTVRIRFLDMQGQAHEQDFDGLMATCVQHEIDHLNGIVFVDHISLTKRDMILRKLKKQKKLGYFDPHDHANCGHDHGHDDHQHEHVHGEHCNH